MEYSQAALFFPSFVVVVVVVSVFSSFFLK